MHQTRRPRLTKGEIFFKKKTNRPLQTKGVNIRAITGFVKKNPSCKFWHPPACQNYQSETGCIYGNKCYFRHVEADETPSKKSKKDGAKGSVALLKESTQLGCVSQDSYPRKSSIQRKGRNWDQNAPSNSPRAPGTK